VVGRYCFIGCGNVTFAGATLVQAQTEVPYKFHVA